MAEAGPRPRLSDPISTRRPSCSSSAVSEAAGRAGIDLRDCEQDPEKLDPTAVSCSSWGREHTRPRGPSPAPPAPPASSGLTLLFCSCFSEVELPLKKDGFTSESTTLEALLRGEGVEKKVDTREEESIQEIQVLLCGLGEEGAWVLLSRAGLHLKFLHGAVAHSFPI